MMLLKTFPETNKVFEAENGRDALEILDSTPINIVLLDLEMPVMDGWETSKRILSRYTDSSIIMISMHDSLQIISDLIELGVHSYLLKNADPEEVHRAINSVRNNDFYYNQIVARALHQKVKKSAAERPNHFGKNDALTSREIEILQLISQELTMKEIGEKLFLSEQTIHSHRKNLMKKTKAKNAVGLVKYALQNGIVSI